MELPRALENSGVYLGHCSTIYIVTGGTETRGFFMIAGRGNPRDFEAETTVGGPNPTKFLCAASQMIASVCLNSYTRELWRWRKPEPLTKGQHQCNVIPSK